MKKRVVLAPEEIEKCRAFADSAAKTQQAIEFGQSDTEARSIAESARDILIGKLAEVAVAKMLNEDFGIKTELDFDVYPHGQWDDNDLAINGWKIDVKSTRTGRWFLIEWNKLDFRTEFGDLPHAFIPCKTGWDSTADEPLGYVEIEGFVETEEILKESDLVLTLRKGEHIPGTSTVLQADNYGILFENIPDNWADIIERVSSTPAPTIKVPRKEPGVSWSYIPEMPKENRLALYSYLTSDSDFLQNKVCVKELLGQGIKLFAFCNSTTKKDLESEYARYVKANLLKVYVPNTRAPKVTVIDGDYSACRKQLEYLSNLTPDFNYEQYIIEHAPAGRSMIVEAGAGTGKTTVMIDRILFLMHTVPDLAFEDIAMITFTNEATQNMKHKIEAALVGRYRAVPSARNLMLLESATNIQISTIHSFSRKMVCELGSSVGYGSSVALRSLRHEKQELVRDVLNDLFLSKKHRRVADTVGSSLHDLEDRILEFWARMDNIGLTDADIAALDWGNSFDEDSEPLHETLKSAFHELNKRYNELKLAEDAISVEDIIRELRRVIESGQELSLKTPPLKYLFVDEFQDTDNSQIMTLSWLVKAYSLNLFVVGDVKQSIYRFRGAVETAFERLCRSLQESTGSTPDKYVLLRNYRTSAYIMRDLDIVFKRLERKKLLEYGRSLIPQRSFPGRFEIKNVAKNSQVEQVLPDILRAALKDCEATAIKNHTEDKEFQHVTVLARTNFQISRIGELCRSEKIPCYIRKEGTLFTSRAAADLCAMLRAYTFPSSAEALFNYLSSPFATGTFDIDELVCFEPGSAEQADTLKKRLEASNFSRRLNDFRIRPVLAVIRELVSDPEIIKRFAADRRDELCGWSKEAQELQISIDCAQYSANLEQLLDLLQHGFSGEMVSLSAIYDYIKINILTNRTDDEPDISGVCGPGCLYGMTVHKAKGLEFDTVVIPFTAKLFRQEADTEILLDESVQPIRVGWCTLKWLDQYKSNYADKKCNSYYATCSAKEMADTDREEARLLYVAMTRAIRRLTVIVPLKHRPHTWAGFLEG